MSRKVTQQDIYKAMTKCSPSTMTCNEVFMILEGSGKFTQSVLYNINDKHVNSVKRKIRWTFNYLSLNKNYLSKVKRGVYKVIGDLSELLT